MKLEVPYRSQWADDAALNSADCGPTCLAMVLNYYGQPVSPDKIYDYLAPRAPHKFTFTWELEAVARDEFGIKLSYIEYSDKAQAVSKLKTLIDEKMPLIALVSYAPWASIAPFEFNGGHFVVVVGYDEDHIYVHDPIFPDWRSTSPKGAFNKLTTDFFCSGWGGFQNNENPNWAVMIGEGHITLPSTQPAPIAPPPPPITIPVDRLPSEPVMSDNIDLRIQALAGYRWVEPVDLNNPEVRQLWLDHLGDFGIQSIVHTVAAGDTLSAISTKYYGEHHRWGAIKRFNQITRNDLWLGEELLIPLVGDSGAHTDPALPSDTIVSVGDLSSGDQENPDVPAFDYAALAEETVGMGFYNPPSAE